jgi:hypothetical protein
MVLVCRLIKFYQPIKWIEKHSIMKRKNNPSMALKHNVYNKLFSILADNVKAGMIPFWSPVSEPSSMISLFSFQSVKRFIHLDIPHAYLRCA